jgi:hypothetical protein
MQAFPEVCKLLLDRYMTDLVLRHDVQIFEHEEYSSP